MTETKSIALAAFEEELQALFEKHKVKSALIGYQFADSRILSRMIVGDGVIMSALLLLLQDDVIRYLKGELTDGK